MGTHGLSISPKHSWLKRLQWKTTGNRATLREMIPRKSVNQAAGDFDNQFKFIHFLNSRYIQHLQEEKKKQQNRTVSN